MNVHSSKYKCTECGKCFRNNNSNTGDKETQKEIARKTMPRTPTGAG